MGVRWKASVEERGLFQVFGLRLSWGWDRLRGRRKPTPVSHEGKKRVNLVEWADRDRGLWAKRAQGTHFGPESTSDSTTPTQRSTLGVLVPCGKRSPN